MSGEGKGNDRFNAEAAAWDNNPDVHRASDGARDAILAAFPSLKESRDSRESGMGSVEDTGLDVLEIGCGTGLLSFRIAPFVRSVLAIDASSGMIAALEQKLSIGENGDDEGTEKSEPRPQNIQPLCVMLTDPEDPALPPARTDSGTNETETAPKERGKGKGSRRKFDLVLSHLVLHHIPNLSKLLHTIFGTLKAGGHIALTDFEDFGPQARRFHPEAKMEGVERHGVDRKWFAGLMHEAGFVDVDVSVAWTMRKEVERWTGEWGEKKPEGGGLEEMEFPFLLCRGRRP